MKFFTSTTLSSALLIASSLFAATPAPVPMPTPAPPTVAQIVAKEVSMLTVVLSLDSAQKTSATTIFTTEETAFMTLATSLATASAALTTAVEANDSTGIGTAATDIGTLVSQKALARGTAEAAFYAILTSDQQTKYKMLLASGFNSNAPVSK